MSARMMPHAAQLEVKFEPFTLARLDDVMQIERASYDCPWSRQNFTDSLYSGYAMQLLVADGPGGEADGSVGQSPGPLLGYFVAMRGVDEVHLLNLTVAPAYRRQGWALVFLDALALWSRGVGAQWLWLEVRVSNLHAQAIYSRYGFNRVGQRKNYYPAVQGQSEDALVMSLLL
ncbi:MAG: ribosomal protein S18-alanine N-acetyltransferase [Burkholderiales bacterium]